MTNMTLNSQMAHDVHASREQVLIESPTLMNDVLDGMPICAKSHEPIAFWKGEHGCGIVCVCVLERRITKRSRQLLFGSRVDIQNHSVYALVVIICDHLCQLLTRQAMHVGR